METIIGIFTIGLIGFITFKLIKANKKGDKAPSGTSGNDGVYREPKDDGTTELPDNPKLRD